MTTLLDGFEVISFPKQTQLTIYRNRVAISAVCLRMIGDPEYIKLLINRAQQKVAIVPAHALEENSVKPQNGSIHNLFLCDTLLKLTEQTQYPVEVDGEMHRIDKVLVFDLTTAKPTKTKKGRKRIK